MSVTPAPAHVRPVITTLIAWAVVSGLGTATLYFGHLG